MKLTPKRYIFNVLIGLDEFSNAIIGGWPGETISARCARKEKRNGLCKLLCTILNYLQPGHCQTALVSEEEHAYQPKVERSDEMMDTKKG